MRYWLVIWCLVLGAVAPVGAEELSIVMVAHTGAFPCNTGDRDVWVANPAGRDIRLKAVEVWMGMSERGVADFWAWAYTYDFGTTVERLLTAIGWDHYAEPTTASNFRKHWSPDWVTLGAVQYLRLRAGCSGYPGIHGDVALTIEYTLAP